MAELVDALDSKSSSERSAGSIPARGTNRLKHSAPLVSRRSDYDGLIQSQNGQLLWGDEQLDAAGDNGQLVDQAYLAERVNEFESAGLAI